MVVVEGLDCRRRCWCRCGRHRSQWLRPPLSVTVSGCWPTATPRSATLFPVSVQSTRRPVRMDVWGLDMLGSRPTVVVVEVRTRWGVSS